MSTQFKTMPMFDLKVYVRVVAAIFSISSVTAFVFALLRMLKPELYYLEALDQNLKFTHYFITSLMIITSVVGFLNSFVVLTRNADRNTGRNITHWLLLDSLFETSRLVYEFVVEAILKGKGPLQLQELLISVGQYLLDSFFLCQMILRH